MNETEHQSKKADALAEVRETGNSVDLITVAKQISAFEFSTVEQARGYQEALRELCQIKRNARIALGNLPKSEASEAQEAAQ